MKQKPNRWLHLKHPDGFDDERFAEFEAHCRIFENHVKAVLGNAQYLSNLKRSVGETPIRYVFFQPELSDDRKIATLPIGGENTLGTRANFENGLSWMLWYYMPVGFKRDLEEGITEDFGTGKHTNWRKPANAIIIGDPWELKQHPLSPPTFATRFAKQSHWLRKNFNKIIGFPEDLLEGLWGNLNDEQKLYISEIYWAGRRQYNLQESLITLAKYDPKNGLDSHQSLVEVKEQLSESLDLRQFLEKIIPQLRDLILCGRDDVRLEIELITDDDIPNVWVVPTFLQQAIESLFQSVLAMYLNKEKFIRIVFTLSHNADYVTLEIRDTRKEFSISDVQAFNQAESPFNASTLVPINLLVSWWAINVLQGQMNVEIDEEDEVLIKLAIPIKVSLQERTNES